MFLMDSRHEISQRISQEGSGRATENVFNDWKEKEKIKDDNFDDSTTK